MQIVKDDDSNKQDAEEVGEPQRSAVSCTAQSEKNFSTTRLENGKEERNNF
jgi:hypothetical protein